MSDNNRLHGILLLPLLALSAYASSEPLETSLHVHEGSYALSVTSSAPQRTSLTLMTLGFIGVQYTAVYINRNDEDWSDEGHTFADGFTHAPVWDDDVWYYNYVFHPWVGSEYYLAARNRGYSPMLSLGYSAALSTFYEYMAENLIQQPSATDLIFTPLGGALFGELRYYLKEKIREHPDSVPGARGWIALLDPLDISIGGYPNGRICFYINWKQDF